MTNRATPYVTAAAATKTFRRPVRSDSLPPTREATTSTTDWTRVARKTCRGHVGLRAADPVDQVVGLVGRQERVGADEQEPPRERPGEVGLPRGSRWKAATRSRSDHGRTASGSSRRSSRRGDEQQDQAAADGARGQEHRDLVALEELDEERAQHRRDRHGDAQHPGDRAALRHRHLVGQDGDEGGLQGVEGHLRQAPPDQHDDDAGRGGDDGDAEHATGQPADHPRAPHAEAGGVRSLSLPNTGAANRASSPPTPVTRARLCGACSAPTSDLIFRARVTSSGAMSISATLM